MANDISHEEEERICRLIKHHGGEIVLNPKGDGEQVITSTTSWNSSVLRNAKSAQTFS